MSCTLPSPLRTHEVTLRLKKVGDPCCREKLSNWTMKLEMDTNLWMPNKGIFNDDYSEEATHPESSIKNIFKNAFDVRL